MTLCSLCTGAVMVGGDLGVGRVYTQMTYTLPRRLEEGTVDD